MMIEKLEQRKLLSATANVIGNGVLVVQLDSTGQNIAFQEFAAGNTAMVQDVGAGGIPVGAGTFAGINAIVILGGAGNDTITGFTTNVPVFIDGAAGNDTIAVFVNVTDPNTTFGAGSVILGGDGDDTIIVAGFNNSTVLGGNGNDTITAGGFFVTSITGTTAVGGDGMLVDGGNGNDLLQSGFNSPILGQLSALTDSTLLGGNGSDTIVDSGSTNVVDGGNGTDSITVVNGDVVVASNGHDMVTTV